MPHQFVRTIALLAAFFISAGHLPAASILWVSDSPPALGFSGPQAGLSDQGFVTILQNAGHTVDRYDNPEAATSLMTPAEIDQINNYDLIIIGRATGSGQFTPGQGDQWNTNIIKPLIIMSPYLVRSDGGRPSWFVGGNGVLPDNADPAILTAVDPASAATDYLLGGVFMSGLSTASPFDELIDRNTSFITNPPEVGGRILLNSAYNRDDTGVAVIGQAVVDFPAGTLVKAGAQSLAGYRMYFSGGSRESATAPHNNIPLYTGRENLSPTGEDIFLRAVRLALNSGTPPAAAPDVPMTITQDPVSATVGEGDTVSFSVAAAGSMGRTLQWQRAESGGLFIDIPASTPFLKTTLTLTNVGPLDNGARFRVIAANASGSATSAEAVLTVLEDTTAPVPVSVGSVDGNSVLVCFNELLDEAPEELGNTATDEFNYDVNGEQPMLATIQPDRKSVRLTMEFPVAGTFTANVRGIKDRKGNAMPDDPPVSLSGAVIGLTSTSVGTVNPVGSVVACSADEIQLTAGGMDLGLTATSFVDSFHYAHRAVSGDFDARVRVRSLVGPLRFEAVAKAILTARESTDAGSPAVNVFVTRPEPGDDTVTMSIRPAAGVNTNHLGTVRPGGLPGNAWLRLARVGDVFTGYRSLNGTDWTELGTTSAALPSSLVLGLAAASHRNGQVVTATFTDLAVTFPPRRPVLANPSLIGTTFSASFESQAGVTYGVQFKNDLHDMEWQTLETIAGDGSTKTITDTGASVPHRFYRLEVQ